MDKQEIIEGNKIIANFDSRLMLDESDPKKETWDLVDPKDGGWLHVSHLKYHEDWNQLMPVVEKIEKDVSASIYYGFTFQITDHHSLIFCHEKGKQDGVIYQTPYGQRPNSKIESVWKATIEFIKFYNSQKQ